MKVKGQPMRYADACCTVTEERIDGLHVYTFTGPCIKTKKPYSVKVTGAQLHAYRQGKKIQDAMPTLSADDREFLISGLSPEGWALVFGDDEDQSCESK
jgi:hypothetical protein